EMDDGNEASTVLYNGNEYVREDRLTDDANASQAVTIMQIGKTYYFIDEEVPLSGKRHVDDGTITIDTADDTITDDVEKMTVSVNFPIFQPDKRYIIVLLMLYVVLILLASLIQFYRTYIL